MNQPFEIPGLGVPIECMVQSWDLVGGLWEASDGTRTELPYAVRLVDYTQAGSHDQPILLGYVSENKPLSIEGVVIGLDSVEQYSTLQYVHDPGLPLVGIGGLLLAVGMTLALYFPYKTIRLKLGAKGSGTECIAGSNWRGEPTSLLEALSGV